MHQTTNALLTLVLGAAFAGAPYAQTYTLTQLPPAPQETTVQRLTGITDDGRIVVALTQSVSPWLSLCAIIENGAYHVLPAGGNSCYPSKPNRNGDFTGALSLNPFEPQASAFIYTNGQFEPLPFPVDMNVSSSSGIAINDDGEVTGWLHTSNGAKQIFRYSNGQFALRPSPSGVNAYYDVNTEGDIAGWEEAPAPGSNPLVSAPSRAVIYNANGGVTQVDPLISKLTPDASSMSLSINNSGQAVGVMYTPLGVGGNSSAGFFYDGRKVQLVAVPVYSNTTGYNQSLSSYLYSVNDNGEAVGYLGGSAILWSKGSSVDLLGAVTNAPAGLQIVSAYYINNQGQILALGMVDGMTPVYVLLTPAAK